ncbi:IucA/IucC family C-terminal-domain containing protein [Brevibacillus agri]|uniref:IucA/IucC family C-terminal-domain containing protein n=1 Tax=Brevibacillus agri TaxID=51101 RepID=UPI001EE4F64F|nr:IucA/IucC family C-terminal-domain containing protein [Brevibacillus agri]MCG5251628.1 Fe-S protein [Brevibacillus agri]MED1822225.1 IucA/IucC family C-terminal-domain containing protein [Brevibacillus agri]
MNKNWLEADESAYLAEHFRLTHGVPVRSGELIPVTELLDEKTCADCLARMSGYLHAPSLKVTASLFAKRYAFLTVAPILYAMTVYNKAITLDIGQCQLVLAKEPGEPWLSRLHVRASDVRAFAAGDRSEWREQIIRSLFAGHIAPLWHTISRVANIPRMVLWENTAVRLFSLYEKRIKAEAGSELRERVQADFACLLKHAPAPWFGEAQNPFAQFCEFGDSEPGAATARPGRIRKTCCYHYKVSSREGFCSACPRAKSR